jgi:hypothetical protein
VTAETPCSNNRSIIVVVFVVGEHRQPFVAAIDNLEYAVGKKNAAT